MTSHEQLLAHLEARQAFKPSTWLDQLEERKKEEINFHNFERERHDTAVMEAQKTQNVHANKKYYSVSQTSKDWVDRWLELNVRDRVFLDYACGNGVRSIQAAKAGAKLAIGLDISDVSVSNARESAVAAGVSDRCRFIQGDCESTELPDNSVDTVLCCGMLHHLDLNRAYPELHRILKPGGKLLGVEALGHNPGIQLYRNLTPHMRTEWETQHILKMRDIRCAEKYFQRGQTKFWHLAVLSAVPFRGTPLFHAATAIGNGFDALLMALPGVRLLAWQVTFELIKPQE
jgi:ubiquinone/menaquinone biosynthesis C-methylase UbiE